MRAAVQGAGPAQHRRRGRSAVLRTRAEAALEQRPGPAGQVHDLGIEARDAVSRCQTIAPRHRRNPGPQRLRRQRSEEHTSELQSLAYLVCRLLLEKKKKKITIK